MEDNRIVDSVEFMEPQHNKLNECDVEPLYYELMKRVNRFKFLQRKEIQRKWGF